MRRYIRPLQRGDRGAISLPLAIVKQAECVHAFAFTGDRVCGRRTGSLQTIVTEGVAARATELGQGSGPNGAGTTVAQPWPNNLADLEQVTRPQPGTGPP